MPQPHHSLMPIRRARLPWVIAGVALAVSAAGCSGASTGTARPAPAPASAPPAAATPAPAPEPAGQIGPGEWLVGVDVAPGTYRSSGPAEEGEYCMWSRKDAAGVGPLDNILASDGTYDSEQMLVTIQPDDVVFRTRGCEPFELVG